MLRWTWGTGLTALPNFLILSLSHSDLWRFGDVWSGLIVLLLLLLWLSFDLVSVCGSRAQTYPIDYFFEQMVGCEQVPHI